MSATTKRTAALASVVALAWACSSESPGSTFDAGAADASPVTPPTTSFSPGAPVITTETDLREGMRVAWIDQTAWMRGYLIANIAALPETDIVDAHLLLSPDHVGDVFKPFYGSRQAGQIAALLIQNVRLTTDFLNATKANDPAAIANAKAALYSNADVIARNLAVANSNWSIDDLTMHFHAFVDFTIAEANARFNGAWSSDVFSYDLASAHAMNLSDFLTNGLITQYRAKIGTTPTTARDETFKVTQRKLWEDQAEWIRVYLVSETAKLPDVSFSTNRLIQNQALLGATMKPFYGDSVADQLTALLQANANDIVALTIAMESGDATAIATAKATMHQDGDKIAQFFASTNPHWNLDQGKDLIGEYLDNVANEVNARLAHNWMWDIIFYEANAIQLQSLSDFVSNGIALQFPAALPPQ